MARQTEEGLPGSGGDSKLTGNLQPSFSVPGRERSESETARRKTGENSSPRGEDEATGPEW